MNKGPQSAIKTLRLSLNDLKAHVKPAGLMKIYVFIEWKEYYHLIII